MKNSKQSLPEFSHAANVAFGWITIGMALLVMAGFIYLYSYAFTTYMKMSDYVIVMAGMGFIEGFSLGIIIRTVQYLRRGATGGI